MEVKLNEIGQMEKELLVTIPPEKVEKERKKILNWFVSRLNLKGFRRGKVPTDIAEGYVSKSVKEQLIAELMEHSFRDAMTDKGIDLDMVRWVRFQLDPGFGDQGFGYKIRAKMYPEVDMDQLMGMEVRIQEPEEVTQDDVNDRLEALRAEAVVPKEKDGPVEEGDLVNLTYTRYQEGSDEPVLKDFSTALKIEPDKELLIEGMKAAILGLKKGEEFDVTGVETVGKGRDVYRITGRIDKVSQLELPELNDDFAKRFGADNMDDLRQKVEKELHEEREALRKNRIRQAIKEKLLSMVDVGDDVTVLREIYDYNDPNGLDMEYLENPEFITEVAGIFKSELVINSVAVKEKIEVEEQDVEAELERIASERGIPLPYVRVQYQKDLENGTIAKQALQNKVLDMLVRYAKVVAEKDDEDPKQAPNNEPAQEKEEQEGEQ